jgi:hypothetical protein
MGLRTLTDILVRTDLTVTANFIWKTFHTSSGDHPASNSVSTGGFYAELKRQGSGVDHLPPSTVHVKNEWSYTSTPLTRLNHEELRLHCWVTHVIKKLSAFQETWSFHIILTGNLPPDRILSHASAVQSRLVLRSILILSSHLRARFPSRLFQSAFPKKRQFIL